jgi:S-adenosylmethionine hydrolase
VVTAAITIRTSYAFFPSGSIHLVVVDPGVGGQRSILVAEGDRHFFIAPDNGILSLLVADHKIETIHRVEDPVLFPASVCPTFHGRDIMAPVAAALANGRAVRDFGSAVPLQSIQLIIFPSSVQESNSLHGQVQRIDNLGNIRTTIRLSHGHLETRSFQFLEICGQRIAIFARTYSDVDPGALLVLIDSSGYLEIAANQARAVEILGCVLGDRIIVHVV